MRPAVIFQITEESQVGEARRAGQIMTEDLAFDEVRAGKVSLVITEAATNLVKHGGGGEILLQAVHRPGGSGIEILAIDKGQGMGDVKACMRDGYSTTATRGGGLGAISRLSDECDIYSALGRGTIIAARFWQKAATRPDPFRIGALQLAYPGEVECGDGWAAHHDGVRTVIAVLDGLGHGPGAAEATELALMVLQECHHMGPSEILKHLHPPLKKTRGAAAAVAAIDRESMSLIYSGIGNVVGVLANPENSHSLISHDGTVGYIATSFHDYKYVWTPQSVLIMHSDGISARSRPDNLSAALVHDPSVIAALFLRDCRRAKDDITILVAKERET